MTDFGPGTDTIRIKGVRGFGYHGVLPEERAQGQEFVVDVVLGLTTKRAAATDDLGDTVDYADVAGRVHGFIVGEPMSLLETLAVRIAKDCLKDFAVQVVEVTVHKPSAPVEVPVEDISVRVTRRR